MTNKPSTGNGSALEWFKSSYSASDSNDCVEVAWRKSSYSAGDSNDCVEVATAPGSVQVRDSKNIQGPRLAFTPVAWADFVTYSSRS